MSQAKRTTQKQTDEFTIRGHIAAGSVDRDEEDAQCLVDVHRFQTPHSGHGSKRGSLHCQRVDQLVEVG